MRASGLAPWQWQSLKWHPRCSKVLRVGNLRDPCTLMQPEALHVHAFILDGCHYFWSCPAGCLAQKTSTEFMLFGSGAPLSKARHRGEMYDHGAPRMHRGRPSVVGKHRPWAPPHCLLPRRVGGQLLARRTGLPAAVPAGAPPALVQPSDRVQMAAKCRQQLSFASCPLCAERSLAVCRPLKNAQLVNVLQKSNKAGCSDSRSCFEKKCIQLIFMRGCRS